MLNELNRWLHSKANLIGSREPQLDIFLTKAGFLGKVGK